MHTDWFQQQDTLQQVRPSAQPVTEPVEGTTSEASLEEETTVAVPQEKPERTRHTYQELQQLPPNATPAQLDSAIQSVFRPEVKSLATPQDTLLLSSKDSVQEAATDINYLVNPTGKFVIGGPHGDTGLTGRKIIVDTYGGKGAHGGGAFSGKDSSKVDRSAAYAARYIAKNMVAAGVADEMLVQLSYAIGVAKPVSIYVNTYGKSHVNMPDSEIANRIGKMFDLRPKAIERMLKLRQPMYLETAAYGHMGRKNEVVKKTFTSFYHETKTIEVELFTWEKLDRVDEIRKAFFG